MVGAISRADAPVEPVFDFSDASSRLAPVTMARPRLENNIHTDATNQMSSAGPINARPAIFLDIPNGLIAHQNGFQAMISTNAHKNKNVTRSFMSFLNR
jgi:hypothetical protein